MLLLLLLLLLLYRTLTAALPRIRLSIKDSSLGCSFFCVRIAFENDFQIKKNILKRGRISFRNIYLYTLSSCQVVI